MPAGRPPKTPAEREIEFARNFPIDWAKILTRQAWGWDDLEIWQMKVMASNSRRLFINCSRQIGKSSILAVKAFWKALTTANSLVLIVAEQRQSNEDIRKVKELAKTYDAYLNEKYEGKIRLTPVSDNITSLEIANGSRVIALPANEKIRGFSAPDMVILDEAAYQPNEVFVAIDPMMTVSQGQFILASTPHGTTGFFYTENGNPTYEKIVVPWNESPRIKAEEIELKKQIYGEAYVKQEYNCFAPDTLITCNPSWRPIGEIEIGTKVLTRTGQFGRVEGVLKRPYKGEMVKMKPYFAPEMICTPNHPFLTRRGWIEAKDLTKDDWLLEAIPQEVEDVKSVKMKDYVIPPKSLRSKWSVHKIETVPINDALLRVLVSYICEGNTSGAKGRMATFAFSLHDEDFVKQLVVDIRSLFGVEAKIYKWPNMINLVCNSIIINRLLEALAGKGALNKKLPAWMLSLPKEKLRLIWDVALLCEGTARPEQRRLGMISKQFVLQLRTILLKLGYRPSFESRNNPTGFIGQRIVNRHPVFSLVVHNDPTNPKSWPRGLNDGMNFHKRIQRVERVPYEGEVVNLQVENEKTYSAGLTVVHNCEFLDDVAALFTERALRDSVDETEDVFSDELKGFEEAFSFA